MIAARRRSRSTQSRRLKCSALVILMRCHVWSRYARRTSCSRFRTSRPSRNSSRICRTRACDSSVIHTMREISFRSLLKASWYPLGRQCGVRHLTCSISHRARASRSSSVGYSGSSGGLPRSREGGACCMGVSFPTELVPRSLTHEPAVKRKRPAPNTHIRDGALPGEPIEGRRGPVG
jgi:hypothetical protein